MQDENSEQATATRLAAASQSEFLSLHEIIARARQNLNQNDWDYIVGGTETEATLRRNRLALDSIAFRPRVLRDVRAINCGSRAFGRELRLPIVLAPVGALETFHPEAALGVVRAAGRFGVAHMLSSVCQPSLEKVAEAAPEAMRTYQLYVRGDEAWVDDHVERAIRYGYVAFCLTVDTAIYSRRERDIAKRHITAGRRRVTGHEFQAALDWRTVARIKKRFQIPLIIKGIATAEDARIAIEHGVEWIYVSNHGGRQLDQGCGTMELLPEIIAAAAGRAKVIIDGSFCRGTDIVKAMASGADLVGIGRMQCFALAAGGEAALVRMLELLDDEVRRTLGLLGVTKLDNLDPSYLRSAAPTGKPGVLSAFPLLKIDEYRY
jgi:glycolate oxidase